MHVEKEQLSFTGLAQKRHMSFSPTSTENNESSGCAQIQEGLDHRGAESMGFVQYYDLWSIEKFLVLSRSKQSQILENQIGLARLSNAVYVECGVCNHALALEWKTKH